MVKSKDTWIINSQKMYDKLAKEFSGKGGGNHGCLNKIINDSII